MSSEIDGGGLIAAPVALGVAAIMGAGWLAWQGGKLLVEASRAADRQIEENKRRREEEARHRKMSALAAHGQLVDMSKQILAQLEIGDGGSITAFAELEQLKYDLQSICQEPVPEDAAQIERITAQGYLKLDSVVRRQGQLASLQLTDSEAGLYRGLSVADLMDDLRIAIAAMEITATVGADVRAADPVALERAKLNKAFIAVTYRIMEALESVEALASEFGLTPSADAWYRSCFSGVDTLIESLYRPTTSNQELKKGIRRLEGCMDTYDMMADSIRREIERMAALYKVYSEASEALGEQVEGYRTFESAEKLEERLQFLQTRAQRAQECAEIYKKLGPSAYLCYAWDCELQQMGYTVHSRKKITELAAQKPDHAKLGDQKLPFYQWEEEDLTQLYAITSECALQVIVHEDGAVSMQTIAEGSSPEIVTVQQEHCSRLKLLHKRLRENWFIFYDYEETAPAEQITTAAAWRTSEGNAWKKSAPVAIEDRRGEGKTTRKQQQTQ